MPNFIKIEAHYNFETKVFKCGLRSATSNIVFMIIELDLLWVSNLTALGIYFIFATKFFWNEGIDTYFSVDEYVLLGRNFEVIFLTEVIFLQKDGEACFMIICVKYYSGKFALKSKLQNCLQLLEGELEPKEIQNAKTSTPFWKEGNLSKTKSFC